MEQSNHQKIKPKKIKLDFKDSKYATGRRKRSIAKVWVKKGNGAIHVNGLKMIDYFKRPVHQIIVTRPFEDLFNSKSDTSLETLRQATQSIDHSLCVYAKTLPP